MKNLVDQNMENRVSASSQATVWVSITGLSLKRFWQGPVFWFYAVRAMKQARRAPGNIQADARTIDGIHHTLSVWKDRKSMLAFLRSDAHRKAIKIFPKIAQGRTYGYMSSEVPNWPEARETWEANGREYGQSEKHG